MTKSKPETQILDPSKRIHPFFTRNNLTPQDQADCYNLISKLYPNVPITPASSQGACSFTLFIGSSTVLQFRLPLYTLDLTLSSIASSTYPSHAPKTSHLATVQNSQLEVFSMSRISGLSLPDLRSQFPLLAWSSRYLENLVISFAAFMVQSWHNSPQSPIPLRKVGNSLVERLKLLSTSLPLQFRPIAKKLLENVELVTSLPWVFTHGDLIAGNMMIEPSDGRLTGLVDWAESEYLPFGVCLYGLEEMLGEMTATAFRYHAQAERLRGLFWDELREGLRESGEEDEMLERIRMARDIGVVLWWGIAWDEGSIDRVVEEGRDVVEIMRLDAFLRPCEEIVEVGWDRVSKL